MCTRVRQPVPFALLAMAAMFTPLAGCDGPNDANIGRAARGTRDAVKGTEKAINDAQKQASDMADQIGKDPKNATPPPTPASPAKPGQPVSDPNAPGRRITPLPIPGVPTQPGGQ